MVGDEHEIARAEAFVHAAGGVGQKKNFRAEHCHQARGQEDILGGVALVKVDAALHDDDLDVAEGAEHKAPAMPGDGGDGEALDIGIVHGGDRVDLVCQCAESGAEDQCHLRHKVGLFPHTGETFLQFLIGFGHGVPPVLFYSEW